MSVTPSASSRTTGRVIAVSTSDWPFRARGRRCSRVIAARECIYPPLTLVVSSSAAGSSFTYRLKRSAATCLAKGGGFKTRRVGVLRNLMAPRGGYRYVVVSPGNRPALHRPSRPGCADAGVASCARSVTHLRDALPHVLVGSLAPAAEAAPRRPNSRTDH